MAGKGRDGRVRLGIAGLDHWYIGLDVAQAAAANDHVELVVVAHRDEARARETASRFGAAEVTTDYASVVTRNDLDMVVTACRTDENAHLCVSAARHGMNIVSVKPIAMTVAEAAAVRQAVDDAGVHFLSWESLYRLSSRHIQLKTWIEEGKIGRPVSALYIQRAGVPTQVWPGVHGTTWWVDPAHAPGGGWIDHAIYQVDMMRWLFGSEVARVGGMTANLLHRDLAAPLEDYGLATLEFAGGQAGTLEVTWTAAPAAGYGATHIVGSEGAVVLGWPSDEARVSGRFEGHEGWHAAALPPANADPVGAMVRVLREGGTLPAGVADACRNLEVCLAFYDAAREGRTREVPST
ncbi:MAG: hypothetical protein NVSMB65_07420 [Chloroflexota bacterium]